MTQQLQLTIYNRFMSVFIKIYIDLCVFVTSRKKWLSIEYVYVKIVLR